jgi:hypothetical protein
MKGEKGGITVSDMPPFPVVRGGLEREIPIEV